MTKNYNVYSSMTFILVQCLSFFVIGFIFTVIAPLIDYLQNVLYPGLSSGMVGFLTACIPIGATFGSALGGRIAQKIGRKKFLFIVDIGVMLASLITIIEGLGALIVGRLCLGFFLGCSTVVSLIFTLETVPTPLRALPGALMQVFIALGILVVFLVGVYLPTAKSKPTNVWRHFFLIPGYVSILRMLLVIMFYNFETPKFNLM